MAETPIDQVADEQTSKHPQGKEVEFQGDPNDPFAAGQDAWTTRERIIQRARTWLEPVTDPPPPPVSYDISGEYKGYRTDCSGYVSMAWNLSSSLTTWTLVNVSEQISKDDLRPGDVLIKNDPISPIFGSHVVLFTGWANQARTAYGAYEQVVPHTMSRVVQYPYDGDTAYVPYRYKDVIDADEIAAPNLKIALQAANGQYLGIDATSRDPSADRRRVGATEIFELVPQFGGKGCLRASDGRHLSRTADGGVTLRLGTITDAEVFEVQGPHDWDLSFKLPDGDHKYLVAVGGGGYKLRSDARSSPWTHFQVFGASVALKAANDRYVSVVTGGQGDVRVDATSIAANQALEFIPAGIENRVMFRAPDHLHALRVVGNGDPGTLVDVHGTRSYQATFAVLPQRGGKVALQTWNGRFLSAETSGARRLLASSLQIGANELFDVVSVPNGAPSAPVWEPPIQVEIALQAANGRYVCAEHGGNDTRVNANRDKIDIWERFRLIPQPNGRVAVRTHSGHYLRAEGGGGGALTALATTAGSWENYYEPPPTIFEPATLDSPWGLGLKAANGQNFVVAVGGGSRELAADSLRNPWAHFWTFGAGFALKASGGQYVSVVDGGGSDVRVLPTSSGRNETFELLPAAADNGVMFRCPNHRHALRAFHGGGPGVVVDANQEGRGDGLGFQIFKVMPQPGGKIALRTLRGYYLAAEGGGGGRLLASSTDIGPNELFTFESIPGRVPDGPHWVPPVPIEVALQAFNGQYVCAEQGGNHQRVAADRNRIDIWERFRLVPQPNGRVAVKTHNGHFLRAEPHGALTSLATALEPWERYEHPPATVFEVMQTGDVGLSMRAHDGTLFVFAVGGGGSELRADGTGTSSAAFQPFGAGVALRAANGLYVSVADGGGGEVKVKAISIGRNESLELLPAAADNRVMFRAPNHRHLLQAKGAGAPVDAEGTSRFLDREKFVLVRQPNDKVALKSSSGTYLSAETAGAQRLIASAHDIGPNELFDLVPLFAATGPIVAAGEGAFLEARLVTFLTGGNFLTVHPDTGWYNTALLSYEFRVTNRSAERQMADLRVFHSGPRLWVVPNPLLATADERGHTFFREPLEPGISQDFSSQLWVQPSNKTELQVSVQLVIGPDPQNSQSLSLEFPLIQVPTAQIRPLVIVPGFTGSYWLPFTSLWVLDPLDGTFDPLVSSLKNLGLTSETTLIPYPYAWFGKHADEISDDLNSRLEAHWQNHERPDYVHPEQFVLLSHSTGGLIVRNLAVRHPGAAARIKQLVLVASPNQGTATAFAFYEGLDPLIVEADADSTNSTAWAVMKVFESLAIKLGLCPPTDVGLYNYFHAIPCAGIPHSGIPLLQELLPPAATQAVHPYLLPAHLRGDPNVFLTNLNSAATMKIFLDRVFAQGKITSVFSGGVDTADQFSVGVDPTVAPLWVNGNLVPGGWRREMSYWDKRATYLIHPTGDDTVTDFSADLTGLLPAGTPAAQRAEIAKGTLAMVGMHHTSYFRDPGVLKFIFSRLLSESADLTASIPIGPLPEPPGIVWKTLVVVTNLCPVSVLVTDPLGRRIGSQTDGQPVNELPGGFYTGHYPDGPDVMWFPDPKVGEYSVQILGLDKGEFNVNFDVSIGDQVVQVARLVGESVPGEVSTFQVSYPPPDDPTKA